MIKLEKVVYLGKFDVLAELFLGHKQWRKISVAQTRPIKVDISANIELHKKLINLAIAYKADAIFFPELSK